jgi:carbon-monoxide dehydrogenase medium subunit
MTPFELVEPHTLREAAGLLASGGPSVRPMGGGTAVMLMMKMGVLKPSRLVSLRGVEKRYSEISEANGELRFGALATLAALERSAAVKSRAPVICRALRTLANERVRNVATVGGHLAHADPHTDLCRLLRDDPGSRRAHLGSDRPGARQAARCLFEMHDALRG